ncbi:hypothetical protein MA16_Dca007412 [Dendrobium catenatum]|uniref:Uncharacterized protein n=1 Tax=Dendrobium catenatum TaxID=906689 RepID=A0A2I0W8Q2_9ASPA|nr:hypothetical protein MA16_Dca007412 [Dendrobium catenatum]
MCQPRQPREGTNSSNSKLCFNVRGGPENRPSTPLVRVVGWDPGAAPTARRGRS